MKSHSMKDVLNTPVNNIFLYLITECQKQYSGNFHVKWNNPRYIRLLTIVRSCSSKTPPDTTGPSSQSDNQKSSKDEKEEPKDTKRSKIVKGKDSFKCPKVREIELVC
jgi:hypothetical protein